MPATRLRDGCGPYSVCLIAIVLSLGLAGCGRRGPLEAPTDPAAAVSPAKPAARSTAGRAGAPTPSTSIATQTGAGVQDTPEDESDDENVLESVNPSPTPKRRTRAYSVPKQSFFLDPIL